MDRHRGKERRWRSTRRRAERPGLLAVGVALTMRVGNSVLETPQKSQARAVSIFFGHWFAGISILKS